MKSVISNIKLNIKQRTLDAMLNAYVSGYGPTRNSVADLCNVSSVTTGKVANALIESGLMCEKQYSVNGERPNSHLFFNDTLKIMLLDITSSIYRMSICDAYGNMAFFATYDYNAELNFSDNFTMFLSRCGIKAKQRGHSYHSICILHPDDTHNTEASFFNVQFYRPTMSDKDRIDEMIYSVFRKHPLLHMSISDAISSAMTLGLMQHSSLENGTSYIFIGKYISAMNITKSGAQIICSPHRMILSNGISAGEYFISNPNNKDAADLLLANIALFMDCAFGSDTIIAESDIYDFDEISMRRINKLFAGSGTLPPKIFSHKEYPSAFILGAIRTTFLKIVQKHILSSSKPDSK